MTVNNSGVCGLDNGIKSDEGNVDATQRDQSSQSRIGYRKLRSPSRHGQSLQIPPLNRVDQVWQFNIRNRSDAPDNKIFDLPLSELQGLGRAELIQLATRYTRQYLDADFGFSGDNIVMAGHQPELDHPGVWYKNFVLSNLGQRFNCAAVNLIVDNDICGAASIRFPKVTTTQGDGKVSVGTISIDGPSPKVPYEAREIQDWKLFESFGGRIENEIGGTVDSPIAARLWPHVIAATFQISGDQHGRLGHAIASGRHRLEHEVGLRTLEVPISWVAQSEAFAMFAKSILINATRFQKIYNEVLLEYRKVHGIRSRSHPVPKLETNDGWTEAPFWVWQKDQPTRRRLFTKQTERKILLSDLTGFEKTIGSGDFVTTFRRLEKDGIAIRPKALMTTMFSRLILCDLFLHGIGGSKYDQLTDVIAARFFSTQLPDFLTLSATMKLPTDVELVGRTDVTAIDQQIRELKFHPETFIANPSTVATDRINQKRDWTMGSHRGERSKAKHLAIEEFNRQLAKFVDIDQESLIASRAETVKKVRASEILGSREYSFCLFPESLIEELKTLARV